MATTETGIVNLALRRVGGAKITGDFRTATSREAIVAQDVYDTVRQDLLSLHNWNFAIRRSQLTASSTDPTFGWDYAYPLPDDFIRLVGVHPTDDDDATVPFRLENQSGGDDRVILTQSNQLYIRYVFDLQDPAVMATYFRDLLAFQLTREFAAALNKPKVDIDLSDKAFRRKLARAKAIDGLEDYPEKLAEGDWVTTREPQSTWDWS